MKKYLLIFSQLLISHCLLAQFDSIVNQFEQDFEQFQQGIEQDYQQFTDKNDSVFFEFLEESWEEFEVFYNEKKEPPKPVVQPEVKTENQPEPIEIKPYIPDSTGLKFSPPEEKKQPEKKEPDNSRESFGKAAININFYGAPVTVINPGPLPPLDHVNSEIINAYFYSIANLPIVSQLIKELRKQQQKIQLNDWGYFKLVQQAVSSMEYSPNQQTLFSWVVLLKSGYNVKAGFTDNEVFLMLPTEEEIYSTYYLIVNGNHYYIQTERNKNNPLPPLTIHKADYPASKFLSLKMRELPQISTAPLNRTIYFNNDSISVPLNKNLIRYYSDYPLCDLEVFFSAPLSKPVMQTLEDFFRPIFADKCDLQKVNVLLKFVQSGFDYKTDNEQFGHEKYFFSDEVFYYPFSDCEDRSVLFTHLVNQFTNFNCIGLDFPGHVNTAVAFDHETEGTYIEIKDKKYTVCDPTYENAPVGYLDARYKKYQPGIINFDN